MKLTTDNPKLNNAIINLSNAMKATDAAVKNIDIDFEKIDGLEEKEAQAEKEFFNIIFAMMPKKISNQMQEQKHVFLFKAKTIDKYILS